MAETREKPAEQYARFRKALGGVALPVALVDLDAFERNADRLFAMSKTAGKRLRIASKSLRVPDLLQRLLKRGGDLTSGLMTYHAAETAFLASQGFDDLLLAYPTAHASDAKLLAQTAKSGKIVSTVVDSEEQLPVLESAAKDAGVKLRVVVELDVSFRPLGGIAHLGSRRSPLQTADAVAALVAKIDARPALEFAGVMAYEGHIAGTTDRNPFTRALNPAKRLVKLLSRGPMEKTRAAVSAALSGKHPGFLFNGGGSGSLLWSGADAALTELTAGSGFVDSHLFDYYRDLSVEPAAFFALQAVRRPAPGIVTCHGGGLIASGEAGVDRLPVPALPAGCKLIGFEGAGEVQTPLILPRGVEIALGDPVFFRHAKAGELAEHFSEYLLVRGDRIESRVPTYRGLGQCFLG